MKKINKFLIFMLLVLIPIRANAFTGSISVSCTPNSVKIGDTISCEIKGNADSKISAIEIGFSKIDNVEVVSFTPANGWEGDDVNNNLIEIYGNEVTNTFDIGTLKMKIGTTATSGEKTINFSKIVFYDTNDKENKLSTTSAKFTVLKESSNETAKGLKSLSVKNGVLGPAFNKEHTKYTIHLNEKTFSINAVAANSNDTLVYTLDNSSDSIDPSNIVFSATNDQGIMNMILTVGTGDNSVKYTFLVFPPEEKQIKDATLSSLTIGGKKVTLSSNKFEYAITLDNVNSYKVDATLSDSDNFEFDSFFVPPVTMSGEQEFTIKVNPKDSSLGISSKTYIITVKKNTSSGGTGTGNNNSSNNKNDVTSNPQTSDVSAFIMALILVMSLFVSISLYKKNLSGYNQ